MRSSKQLFYDNLYYSFEQWLITVYENVRTWHRYLGVHFSKEFHTAYKTVIRPYWAQFGVKSKIHWAKKYYFHTGSTDPRYIPNDLYIRRIIPHFNPNIYVRPLTDKNLNNLVLPHARRPETIFKHMTGTFCRDDFSPIPREEAATLLRQPGNYVIKPSTDSSGGNDICFFPGTEDDLAIQQVMERYDRIDYLVQRAVIQHPELNRLNASSINTIRLVTLVFQGEAIILSSILRVGAPGSRVDNIGAGGYQCTIRPDGFLEKTAYTHRFGKEEIVEQTTEGVRFENFRIPVYDKVCAAALDYALRMPHMKYIAWDLAVDENEDVILIEFNAVLPGQNQATCGPTFGDLTDEILTEVFGKK